jgi:hypothetical protein
MFFYSFPSMTGVVVAAFAHAMHAMAAVVDVVVAVDAGDPITKPSTTPNLAGGEQQLLFPCGAASFDAHTTGGTTLHSSSCEHWRRRQDHSRCGLTCGGDNGDG